MSSTVAALVNLLTFICPDSYRIPARGRSVCPSVNFVTILRSAYNQLASHYKVSIQTEFWLITHFIQFHEIT